MSKKNQIDNWKNIGVWLTILLIFDVIYYYFILHLTHSIDRGPWPIIRIDGLISMILVSLISLGCVRFVKANVDKQQTQRISRRYISIILYSFFLFITLAASIQFVVEYLAGQQRGIAYLIGNGLIYVFLHLIVGNAYIGKSYFEASAAFKEKLLISEKSKAELELKLLQQQMEPHFLFNNLNTLTSLIEGDPKNAITFTRGLSQVLRYVTQNAQKELISLTDEFQFLEHYMELLNMRFGGAYKLLIDFDQDEIDHILTVPLSFQIVIENAIKHNSSSRSNPLEIEISLQEESISISNEIRPKLQNQDLSSGIGLSNLNDRFLLTSGKELTYGEQGHTFLVRIPIIKEISDANIDH